MRKKITITILIFIPLFCILFIMLINVQIKSKMSKLCNEQEKKQVALVLGSKVYASGRMSDIFRDRVDTAIELYNEQRVKKLLISGDHGSDYYDEVNAAKEYLLGKGIEGSDIFLDHAGFDTYDSVYRAKEIFKTESLIIVTQNFHLPRALFIADKLDLDACGKSADIQTYIGEDKRELREIFARVKAWFNVLFNSKPKFLGNEIPISGDGKSSWD